jgi:uncharacterized membrane protein (UPF0182 family)
VSRSIIFYHFYFRVPFWHTLVSWHAICLVLAVSISFATIVAIFLPAKNALVVTITAVTPTTTALIFASVCEDTFHVMQQIC